MLQKQERKKREWVGEKEEVEEEASRSSHTQKLSSPEETPFGGRSAVSLNRFAPLWVQVGSWIPRERLSMDRSLVAASAARYIASHLNHSHAMTLDCIKGEKNWEYFETIL